MVCLKLPADSLFSGLYVVCPLRHFAVDAKKELVAALDLPVNETRSTIQATFMDEADALFKMLFSGRKKRQN